MKIKPGIRFTEKMVGKYKPSNSETEVPCEFTLTIESVDVERMINCDPDHAAKLSGTVTCLALSTSPMTVSEGTFLKCEYVKLPNININKYGQIVFYLHSNLDWHEASLQNRSDFIGIRTKHLHNKYSIMHEILYQCYISEII